MTILNITDLKYMVEVHEITEDDHPNLHEMAMLDDMQGVNALSYEIDRDCLAVYEEQGNIDWFEVERLVAEFKSEGRWEGLLAVVKEIGVYPHIVISKEATGFRKLCVEYLANNDMGLDQAISEFVAAYRSLNKTEI